MKQTAVEWLVNEANLLENNGWILPLIEQAKEMEKRQMIDALDICQRTDFYVKYEGVEHYYNETFKNK